MMKTTQNLRCGCAANRLSPTELWGSACALLPFALISVCKLLLGAGGEGISTLTGGGITMGGKKKRKKKDKKRHLLGWCVTHLPGSCHT